ncbi:MAG: MFS transporter [Myxococcota bacterium]
MSGGHGRGSDRGLRLLGERDLRRLLAARLVSAFGSAMAPIAIAFGVLELTGSATAMGVVIASETGAAALFQLVGGALADRGSRQRVMVAADLLALASQGLIALLLIHGEARVAELAALMAVSGIAFALHYPAAMGLVPLVVDGDRLQSANALLSLARSGAIGMGAACAGVLVATVGAGWAIAIDAASFGVSAALVASLRPRSQPRATPSSVLRDLRQGWREFTSHRWLWTVVIQFSVLLAAYQASFAVVGPLVAMRRLGGATDWGWIAGAYGAGLLCGGVAALQLRVRRPILLGTLLTLLLALPPLLLVGPAPVFAVAAGAFAAGVGFELFMVLWYTTLQTHVAPEALSRVIAYDTLGSIVLIPLAEAAAGPLADAVGTSLTLWIAVGMIVLPTLAVLGIPEVRTLRARVP